MSPGTAVKVDNLVEAILRMGGELTVKGLSRQQFITLSEQYPGLRMEREKNGNISIMTPVKGGSGFRENRLSTRITIWRLQTGQGEVFSPSTGFDLPGGAVKSPDVAWLSNERLAQLSPRQIEEGFIPMAPDFVAEIRSKSDSLSRLKKKMQESWMANGVRLAWLIDPYGEKAYIYRNNMEPETIIGFDKVLSGETVMVGFILELSEFKLLS
ncbi:MAG: Uma2 family endonuclease [Phaeodactylibacter sp.]|nr:Uma2 family endonuclease [Phaeodactylibacter sp.]MCB9302759.1 Uma2 family endonuclease [Lewinellaceae bacterium]